MTIQTTGVLSMAEPFVGNPGPSLTCPLIRIPFDAAAETYSALSSSATSVTDFFASPNSIVVPSA